MDNQLSLFSLILNHWLVVIYIDSKHKNDYIVIVTLEIMALNSVNSCTNCENLEKSFNCSIHNVVVDLNNTCDNHNLKVNITKSSSCSNCSNHNTSSCSHPKQATNDLLCFDWTKVGDA